MTPSENLLVIIFHRIRNKIGVATILISIIPILILGIYGYTRISKYIQKSAIRNVEENLDQLAGRMEVIFRLLRDDVLYLSNMTNLKRFVEARTASDKERAAEARADLARDFIVFAEHHTRETLLYYQVRYIDEAGKEIVRVENRKGKILLIPDDELQDKSTRYYFKETSSLKKNELYISPLDLNREHGAIELPPTPVIRYATPVVGAHGEKRGIVIVNIFGEAFLGIVRKAQIPKGVRIFMVDGEGYYIRHPDSALLWGGPRDYDTGHNLKNDFPGYAPAILTQDKGVLDSSNQEIIFFRAVYPNADDPGRRFVLCCTHPYSIVYRPLYAFQKVFLLVLVATFAAAVLISLIIASKLTRPLKTLQAGAERIGKGAFDEEIVLTSKDELASLAESFNKMGGELKHYMQNLKETTAAKERTESELRIAHTIQQQMLPQTFLRLMFLPEISLPVRSAGTSTISSASMRTG